MTRHVLSIRIMLALALNWQVRGRRSAFVGAALAGAYTVRPTNAIPLAFGAAWAWLDPRARVAAWLAGAACVLALFAAATRHVYGTWLPPYYQPSFFGANYFFWEALGGQLVSPARGLFVYSPVLLGSIAGAAIKLRQRRFTALDLSLALAILAHWVVISTIRSWWGGHSYGPRFFTDMLPYLVYFLIPVVAWLRPAARELSSSRRRGCSSRSRPVRRWRCRSDSGSCRALSRRRRCTTARTKARTRRGRPSRQAGTVQCIVSVS